MSKFVKGQKVKIKDDLIVKKCYDGCGFLEPMLKYRGKYGTIKEVDEDGDYRLDISGCWWSDAMLERVYCSNCLDSAKSLSERPCCDCINNNRFTPKEERLEVNPPTLDNLVHIIVETCKTILENDPDDKMEKPQLDFIKNLVVACCDYQLDSLFREEEE